MPRPNCGSIDVRTHVDGAQTFYLRLTVDGRRHRVRLGSDRDGWTPGRAMVALERAARGDPRRNLAARRSWPPAPAPARRVI